jgi:DNA-directed RNA polymerase specialized sigma24 family protein
MVATDRGRRARDSLEVEAGAFEQLFARAEPRLRRAFVAAYGPDLGREATANALGWAWAHRSALAEMKNPIGYLWRVGQSSVRGELQQRPYEFAGRYPDRGEERHPVWDSSLIDALRDLSPRQRAVVVLVHGYAYSLVETAAILGCRVSTVRNHSSRALRRLRKMLTEDDQ